MDTFQAKAKILHFLEENNIDISIFTSEFGLSAFKITSDEPGQEALYLAVPVEPESSLKKACREYDFCDLDAEKLRDAFINEYCYNCKSKSGHLVELNRGLSSTLICGPGHGCWGE